MDCFLKSDPSLSGANFPVSCKHQTFKKKPFPVEQAASDLTGSGSQVGSQEAPISLRSRFLKDEPGPVWRLERAQS